MKTSFPSAANWLTTRLDSLVNWGRATASGPCPSAPPAVPSNSCDCRQRFDVRGSAWSAWRFHRARPTASSAPAVSRSLASVIRRIYDRCRSPKWVISMGACASSGGVFDNYAMVQGIDTVVPVDITFPAARRGPKACLRHPAAPEKDQGRELHRSLTPGRAPAG